MLLGLRFQEILDGLGGNGLSSWLARKRRDGTAACRHFGRGLESLADQIGHDSAEALFTLLSEVFGEAQNVFIQIDGRAHEYRVVGVMP